MAMSLRTELTTKFGHPNGDGEFLVGVLDTGPETPLASAKARARSDVRAAARRLGLPPASVLLDDRGAHLQVSTGVSLSVTLHPVDEVTPATTLRDPTPAERATWQEGASTRRDKALDRAWREAGFTLAEADRWKVAMGRVLAERHDQPETQLRLIQAAITWAIARFTPDEATAWSAALGEYQDGPELVHVAREWRDRDFDPDEASAWAGSWPGPGETPEGAELLRGLGWNPYEVWLLDAFIDPAANPAVEVARREFAQMPRRQALNMARAGMAPSDYEEQVSDEDWDSRYRARFATRTPIDLYRAMHINHHIWLSYREEIADDIPFHDEPLNDLHNPHRAPHQAVPAPVAEVCPGSGGDGLLHERDGWDEWRVECPECGATWVGGAASPLPEHRSATRRAP